jgi:hypothetical protein
MSHKLSKIARRFTIIINKRADFMNDPLLKKSPEKNYIQPEMTPELDEVVKDSLNLVILLERAFRAFQKESIATGNLMGRKLADNALIDLEDVEELLGNSELLDFDLDSESSYLDVMGQDISMIKGVLDMINEGGSVLPEFRKLDHRVYGWIAELMENCEKLHDQSMSQSEFYDTKYQQEPLRMLEQDSRSVDEIDPEEIHPDFA